MTGVPAFAGRWLVAVLVGASVGVGAGGAGAQDGEAWFEEIAAGSDIDFEHVRALEVRYWFPEIMSGGAAWCDYDGDGDPDLYLVQGGELDSAAPLRPANRLYRNEGENRFVEVTERAGVGDRGYGMGAVCADYDGDGDLDLYVTNVGPNALYRNNGNGTFTDVTAASGTGDPGWGTSGAFVDYDGDGDLDLFVVNYVRWAPEREIVCTSGARRRDYCQPENYRAPARDTLYRNEGDGRFTDVSESSGIAAAFGNGLGVVASDFDGDGRPDLYVANDGDPNQLWINRGDGTFGDEALIRGAAVNMTGQTEAGMGVAAEDIDGDGDADLFMSHLRGETNTLYLNREGFFEDVTATAGLAAPSLGFTGFGTGFADFDHDGRLDLYVANGRVGQGLAPLVPDDPFAEPDLLFRGLGGGRFAEVLPRGGTRPPPVDNGRAAAFADSDGDGDVDLAVVGNGGPVRLLRNRAGAAGPWVRFRLLDPSGGPALGARLRLRAGAEEQWREVRTAYGYCASHDPALHFGLGPARRVEEALIVWPSGRRLRLSRLEPGRDYSVFEAR